MHTFTKTTKTNTKTTKTTNTMSSFPHINDELANAKEANHLARETYTLSLQTLHSLGAEETEEMMFQEAPSRKNYDVYYETQSIMQATSRILEANDCILEINAQLLAADMPPAIPMDATCVPPATAKKASGKKAKKELAKKKVKRRSTRKTNHPSTYNDNDAFRGSSAEMQSSVSYCLA